MFVVYVPLKPQSLGSSWGI